MRCPSETPVQARHLWIDFVITAALTSMETIWHLAQSEGSIRLQELWLKEKKRQAWSRGGGTWCNFVWSPHWPCVLSARGPLITFKFLWAHEKTRHRFDKKWKREKKKNYGNTKWGGMRLWSSAFWYLVESLCNNILKVLRIHTGLQRKGYSTEKGRGGTYWTFYSDIEKCKSWYSIPMHCTSHTNVTCFYPRELDVYAKEKRETVAIRRNLRMTIVGIIMTGSLRWM